MARLSEEDKEKILADFHTGHFSQRELAKRYGVSVATINKMTKGLKPKNEHKVNTLVSVNRELAEQSEHEVNSVHKVVDERVKHLLYFSDTALRNQKLANEKISEESELFDLKLHSEITAKNKQTVLGKDVDTQININTQNNVEVGWE